MIFFQTEFQITLLLRVAQGAKRPRSTKSMVRIAAVLILAISTAPVVAQGPGWTANSTVAKLVVTANGGVNVRLSPELTSCVSQSGYGENYASISPNHLGINRMQADLLAAYLSGTAEGIGGNIEIRRGETRSPTQHRHTGLKP